MLKAIHAQEDASSTKAKAEEVARKLKELKLEKASRTVDSGAEETLTYYDFPPNHGRYILMNKPLERPNREIRRRTRVMGSFPDGHAALMLVAARLRYIAGKKWGMRKYIGVGADE